MPLSQRLWNALGMAHTRSLAQQAFTEWLGMCKVSVEMAVRDPAPQVLTAHARLANRSLAHEAPTALKAVFGLCHARVVHIQVSTSCPRSKVATACHQATMLRRAALIRSHALSGTVVLEHGFLLTAVQARRPFA